MKMTAHVLLYTLAGLLIVGCQAKSESPSQPKLPPQAAPESPSKTVQYKTLSGAIFNVVSFPDHSIKVIEPMFGNLSTSGNANAICKSIDLNYNLATYDVTAAASNEVGAVGGNNGTFTIGKISEKFTSVYCIDNLEFKVPPFNGVAIGQKKWMGTLGQLSVRVGDRDVSVMFTEKLESFIIEKSCQKNGFPLSYNSKLDQNEVKSPKPNQILALDFDSTQSQYKIRDYDTWSDVSGFLDYSINCVSGKTLKDYLKKSGRGKSVEFSWPEKDKYPNLRLGHLLTSEHTFFIQDTIQFEWPFGMGQRVYLHSDQAYIWAPVICQEGFPVNFNYSGLGGILKHAVVTPRGSVYEGDEVATNHGDMSDVTCLSLPEGYSFRYDQKVIEENKKNKKVLMQNTRIESHDGREVHYFSNPFYVCLAIGMHPAGPSVTKQVPKNPGQDSYSLKISGISRIDFSVSTSNDYIQEVTCAQEFFQEEL